MSNAALQLEQLFIFHPRLGSEAGEKLLYFHPEHTPLAEQHNALGLVVALEGLLANFGVASPFELLATAQRRYVVLQPEPSLWLVAVHMLPPSAPAATARQRGAIEEEAEAQILFEERIEAQAATRAAKAAAAAAAAEAKATNAKKKRQRRKQKKEETKEKKAHRKVRRKHKAQKKVAQRKRKQARKELQQQWWQQHQPQQSAAVDSESGYLLLVPGTKVWV